MNTIDEAPAGGKTTFLSRLFPQCIDNTYHGYKIALGLFGLVVAVRGPCKA